METERFESKEHQKKWVSAPVKDFYQGEFAYYSCAKISENHKINTEEIGNSAMLSS